MTTATLPGIACQTLLAGSQQLPWRNDDGTDDVLPGTLVRGQRFAGLSTTPVSDAWPIEEEARAVTEAVTEVAAQVRRLRPDLVQYLPTLSQFFSAGSWRRYSGGFVVVEVSEYSWERPDQIAQMLEAAGV